MDADDELLSTSGGFTNAYGYNANGDQTTRTLSGTSYTLGYDYDDQLTSTGGASFAYDAAGRRVSRTAGGVTTNFLYDGDEVLLEQQGGATTATYAYGNALTRKDGETPLFDGQGSERTVTNTSGAVQATLTLSAFGQAVASSGSSTDAYGFGATSGYRGDGDGASATTDARGDYGDDGDGLLKVGCRYYDPATGSFLTRDTDLSRPPYAYCDADPVNRVDPSGHDARGDTIACTACLVGALVALEVVTAPISVPITIGIVVGTAIIGTIGVDAGNEYGNQLNETHPGLTRAIQRGFFTPEPSLLQ